MVELRLSSWDKLEAFLVERDRKYRDAQRKGPFMHSTPLYRGHADSRWRLQSTLERENLAEYDASAYAKDAGLAHRYLFGRARNMPVFDEEFEIDDYLGVPMTNYGFYAYLRHHGFPSPLLDWSASPYIALYFALTPPPPKGRRHFSLYCFQEFAGNGKASSPDLPTIHGLGPSIRTHPRHHLQQCEYTVCVKQDGYHGSHAYVGHESALNYGIPDQDHMVKLTIPISQRILGLRRLRLMNINAHSLMSSEDSLVQSVSERVFHDRDWLHQTSELIDKQFSSYDSDSSSGSDWDSEGSDELDSEGDDEEFDDLKIPEK